MIVVPRQNIRSSAGGHCSSLHFYAGGADFQTTLFVFYVLARTRFTPVSVLYIHVVSCELHILWTISVRYYERAALDEGWPINWKERNAVRNPPIVIDRCKSMYNEALFIFVSSVVRCLTVAILLEISMLCLGCLFRCIAWSFKPRFAVLVGYSSANSCTFDRMDMLFGGP